MLVVAALVIHFGVVKREERYLEAKFGDAYRQYKASVPRYGLPPELSEISQSFRQSSICTARALLL